jgi:hypothetical protein
VRSLGGLLLAAEHQLGHGALYDAVNHGRIDITRQLVACQQYQTGLKGFMPGASWWRRHKFRHRYLATTF